MFVSRNYMKPNTIRCPYRTRYYQVGALQFVELNYNINAESQMSLTMLILNGAQTAEVEI